MDKFISGGPKKYAFSVICPSTGKRKGITLKYENSTVVNFTSLEDIIMEDVPPVHA
jgi:hypothetical protein